LAETSRGAAEGRELGLARADKALVWTLLPLFGICFALHVREIRRTGLAQPPVFAVPGPGGDGYPRVGGLRLERGIGWRGLQRGDALIQVGDADLRGVGHVGFDAIALEQAGAALEAPLVYERDGRRETTSLRMQPYALPWFRIPLLLSWVGVALLVLWRAPGSRDSRLLFAAFLSFAVFMTPILGGSRLQTVAHHVLFFAGGPLAIVLGFRWLIAYPPEVPASRRLPSALAWIGLSHLGVRLGYLFGGPWPPERVPLLALLSDTSFVVAGAAVLWWNYAHADPIGRRRLKWLLYAFLLWGMVSVASLVVAAYGRALPALTFPDMVVATSLAMVLLPIGIGISILRYNLVDVDRLLAATAAYAATFAAASALALAVIPRIDGWLAQGSALRPAHIDAALLVGFLALAASLGRSLDPGVRRLFFRDRVRVERDARQLIADLGACRSRDELLDLVTRRLEAILRPESCRTWVAEAARLRPAAAPGPTVAEGAALDATGPLARSLERNPAPLRITARSLAAEVPDLAPGERALLAALGAEVVVPLREGAGLAAAVFLGPKRSGDIYTSDELSLLRALAERASDELGRLASARELARERDRGRELAELKQRAEEASLEKTRFLAAASHDLRQPLHAVGIFASTLAEQVRDPAARDTVEKLETSVAALRDMMTKLLDLSRIDAGAVKPEIGAFDVEPLVLRLVGEFEGAARAKGLRLRAETSPAVVASDPVLLGRIVSNLLANAVRYTDAGEVVARTRTDGDEVEIEIEDTGPGIPEDRRRQVFEEFVRLHDRQGEDGLGLGLSIVERLAKLLGHELALRSAVGRGSSFRVRAPRAERGAPAAGARAPAAAPGAALAGRVVVVVDDDRAVLEAMSDLLRGWGCEPITALDAAAAVEAVAARERPPDAIVADYRLRGGETGLAAIDAVRARAGRAVRAVVITGETDPDTRERIRAAGLRELTKPVAPHRLRALLTELLRD
jgi:signal transduction histidine kinase/CheY-like chemotaxis protein